jgi:hypothetical protein
MPISSVWMITTRSSFEKPSFFKTGFGPMSYSLATVYWAIVSGKDSQPTGLKSSSLFINDLLTGITSIHDTKGDPDFNEG